MTTPLKLAEEIRCAALGHHHALYLAKQVLRVGFLSSHGHGHGTEDMLNASPDF
jgi:hypothetical protein